MEEDFEASVKTECHTKEDLKFLTAQIKKDECLLRHKRRWLMGLSLKKVGKKRVEEQLPPNDMKIMPESLLREDDVSYEVIRSSIEMGFREHNNQMEQNLSEDFEEAVRSCDFKDIVFLLDGMTNKGLCSFIKILSSGMVKFEKTNWSMKRTIKELLQKVKSDKNEISKLKLDELLVILKDPKSYRVSNMLLSTPEASNMLLSTPESYRSAAMKVLDALGDLSTITLLAMQRKLRGVRGFIPTTRSSRPFQYRDSLLRRVRKECMEILDLPKVVVPTARIILEQRLASALGVAGLALKLLLHCPPAMDFRKFSPKTEALQNDIAKAIFLLEEVNAIELKKVQLLLDPNMKSDRVVRRLAQELLTEYLFECSDMDNIPENLIGILDIILNIRPKQPLPSTSSEIPSSVQKGTKDTAQKENVQKEVEYVLNISAQAKRLVLDRLPEHEFDEDFAHAYLEDYEESDALFISDEDNDEQAENISDYRGFHSHYSQGQTESIGETNPAGINSPASRGETNDCSPHLSPDWRLRIPKMDPGETSEFLGFPAFQESNVSNSRCVDRQHNPSRDIAHKSATKQNLASSSHPHERNSSHGDVKSKETTNCSPATPASFCSNFPVEQTCLFSQQSRSGNQYLEVQEASDVTSMIAYRFVGRVLFELSKIGGLKINRRERLYLRSSTAVPEDSEASLSTLVANFAGIWKAVLEN